MGARIKHIKQSVRWGSLLALCSGAVAASMLVAASQSRAGEAKAVMPVGASVLAYTQVTTVRQPDHIAVSAGDVARGYVDLPAAAVISIRSNHRDGHVLCIQSFDPLFIPVGVRGNEGGRALGTAASGVLAVPSTALPQPIELSFRLALDARLQPGSYAWPLTISVEAL